MKFECPNCFSFKNVAGERNQIVDNYDQQRHLIPPNRFRELAKVLFGKQNGSASINIPRFDQYKRKQNTIERKHKVKKRDAVKTTQRGKFRIKLITLVHAHFSEHKFFCSSARYSIN